jgi:hypothetical protein
MPPRGKGGEARPRSKAREKAPPPPDTESPLRPGFAPECLVCPFGLLFFSIRQTRPEVLEHLLKAGHELFLAFKSVADQFDERWQQAESLQRITVR